MTTPRESPRLISVVIPVLDAAGTLPEQLEALLAQDYAGDFELVIADNGSTDRSVEVAERWLPRFPAGRVVNAAGPRCASYARNAGAAQARGDFLLFTDADDVARRDWLRSIAEAAPHGDLVAGGVDVDGLSDAVTRSWHPRSPRESAVENYRFLTYASGTNTGVWADVFERVGGFDVETAAGEDVEFSWRAQLAGHRVVLAPEAVVQERLKRRLRVAARKQFRYGSAGPHLYRRFRGAGMPPAPATRTAHAWGRILGTWPVAAWSPRRRGRWALEAAYAVGKLAGSARNRVLYL